MADPLTPRHEIYSIRCCASVCALLMPKWCFQICFCALPHLPLSVFLMLDNWSCCLCSPWKVHMALRAPQPHHPFPHPPDSPLTVAIAWKDEQRIACARSVLANCMAPCWLACHLLACWPVSTWNSGSHAKGTGSSTSLNWPNKGL